MVEIDGGQHDAAVDRERTEHLEKGGFNVLRFWNNEVLENPGGVLETILAAAKARVEGKPSPCPLPLAGEEKK